jgi:hypothetical protein
MSALTTTTKHLKKPSPVQSDKKKWNSDSKERSNVVFVPWDMISLRVKCDTFYKKKKLLQLYKINIAIQN